VPGTGTAKTKANDPKQLATLVVSDPAWNPASYRTADVAPSAADGSFCHATEVTTSLPGHVLTPPPPPLRAGLSCSWMRTATSGRSPVSALVKK